MTERFIVLGKAYHLCSCAAQVIKKSVPYIRPRNIPCQYMRGNPYTLSAYML